MKKKVILDVDGVLAGFYPAVCTLENRPNKPTKWLSLSWINNIWNTKIHNNKEFWDTLPVINPPEDIDFVIDSYITSIPPKMLPTRIAWLRRNGFPKAPVIETWGKSKLNYVKARGNNVIMVDDKPSTCKELLDAEIPVLQFLPPYLIMEDVGVPIITSLKQIKFYL